MKSEREIREKIDSLLKMKAKVEEDENEGLVSEIENQIDMLLWVVGDESGLPPLDEDGLYSCYNGVEG